MPLISVPHNLKTEVLSWPFPSGTVVPLEDNKTVVLLSTMHNTEEISADSEKEKLLLPVFHWFRLYANLTRCFLYPEILDGGHTESSYNVSTENDINVISTAAAMVLGSPNPRPPALTP